MNDNDELDKLLLSRAYDLIDRYERSYRIGFLGFLNEREILTLKSKISPKLPICFFGGYEGAERLMFSVGAEPDGFPVTAFCVSFREMDKLTHRDFLGALMNLGIERDTVGDILVETGRAVIFVKDDVAPYIQSQLNKVGKVGVKITLWDHKELPAASDFDENVYALSSLRLDVFVAAICHLSRDKAARLIRSDAVAVDHQIEDQISRTLDPGNTVTVKKYGKFVFTALVGESRKGKLRAKVKHFR